MFFRIKRDYGNDVTQEKKVRKAKQRKEKLKRDYCQPHRIL